MNDRQNEKLSQWILQISSKRDRMTVCQAELFDAEARAFIKVSHKRRREGKETQWWWQLTTFHPLSLCSSNESFEKKEIHLVQIDNAEEIYTVWSNKGECPRKRFKVWRGPYTMGLLFRAQLTKSPFLSPLRFHIKRNLGGYLALAVAGVQRCSTRVLATPLHCKSVTLMTS